MTKRTVCRKSRSRSTPSHTGLCASVAVGASVITISGNDAGVSLGAPLPDHPCASYPRRHGTVSREHALSHSFLINRERAIDYLNTRDRLYVVDAYAGWDPRYRIKVGACGTNDLQQPAREHAHTHSNMHARTRAHTHT